MNIPEFPKRHIVLKIAFYPIREHNLEKLLFKTSLLMYVSYSCILFVTVYLVLKFNYNYYIYYAAQSGKINEDVDGYCRRILNYRTNFWTKIMNKG